MGALNCSLKFLSPEAIVYFSKSTIQPYVKYCFVSVSGLVLVAAGDILDKIQQEVCRTVSSSRVASFEPLSKCD